MPLAFHVALDDSCNVVAQVLRSYRGMRGDPQSLAQQRIPKQRQAGGRKRFRLVSQQKFVPIAQAQPFRAKAG
jgi:hypothetical protein